ncbi:MAG: TlpA family protein disulfide reductase [Balneolaceae bacterium]|nr:TlpA family protein disulfide reductase [Balneolaceae bacterium]
MAKKDQKKKKSTFSFKREAIEWGVILGIFGILYFTGLHTEVIGKLQSVFLYTGLISPDTELAEAPASPADYDMPLLSLDGERTTLEAFEGKTIFLNFWATWCPPCIAEMPNIQSLYEDIASEDIVFVMLSLDKDPQKARDFIARKDFTFPVYSLDGRRPIAYNSEVVPTTYVISPDGSIMLKHQGMANYDSREFRTFLHNISSE